MERVNNKEDQRSRINRIISYIIIFVSAIMLAFCISQIVRYIAYVNKIMNKKRSPKTSFNL